MDEATHKQDFKPIVLRELFMGKNPKVGRWIPGFIYRFLSRMLRIDFFNNTVLYNHGYKKNVGVKGKEHLGQDGRFIFVSNHPLGGFHGMMLISEISRLFPNLKVLANDILEMFFLPNESYKHRNSHFVITFGKPIPFNPLTCDINN